MDKKVNRKFPVRTLKHSTVVIGSSIEAVTYSHLHGCPIIYNDNQVPSTVDFFPANFDLTNLYIKEQDNKVFVTQDGTKEVGIPKYDVYKRLSFFNGISGLALLHNTANSIKIKDNTIIVSSENVLFKVEYEKLIVFGIENVGGEIDIENKKTTKHKTIDWFNVRRGSEHQYDWFSFPKEDFIREVYFYPSLRTDGNLSREKIRKDLVCASYLTDKQIQDLEYSDFNAKFIIQREMKENGIKGRLRGTQRDGIRLRYDTVEIEHYERKIYKNMPVGLKNTEKIEFNYTPIEEMIANFDYEDEEYNKLYTRFINKGISLWTYRLLTPKKLHFI
jgi:hypothetical protein